MPLARLEGLGEDVGSLQLSVNVFKAAVRLLNDLFDATYVDLVGALNMAQLLREAGLCNNDGGLVVLTNLKVKG